MTSRLVPESQRFKEEINHDTPKLAAHQYHLSCVYWNTYAIEHWYHWFSALNTDITGFQHWTLISLVFSIEHWYHWFSALNTDITGFQHRTLISLVFSIEHWYHCFSALNTDITVFQHWTLISLVFNISHKICTLFCCGYIIFQRLFNLLICFPIFFRVTSLAHWAILRLPSVPVN